MDKTKREWIKLRAYQIYENRKYSGLRDDALLHWCIAEREWYDMLEHSEKLSKRLNFQ